MNGNGNGYKVKHCLRCGKVIVVERFLFLCDKCRKINAHEFDWTRYVDHSREVILEARRHG